MLSARFRAFQGQRGANSDVGGSLPELGNVGGNFWATLKITMITVEATGGGYRKSYTNMHGTPEVCLHTLVAHVDIEE